jgi:hypothetical protein
MVGSGLLSSSAQLESVWTLLAPAAAILLSWMAGATFAMNPFGDEGPVLSTTLVAISGSAYVRGLMLPGLLFGFPLVVLVTAVAALAGPFELSTAAGLVAISVLATLVAVTTAPAVGMWFPRFSAISIGQSRDVVPPRLVTTTLHFLGVTAPGTLLALLLLDPQLARALVAGVVGFLPAALLTLAAGRDGGVLADIGTWFQSLGAAIQAVGAETFQFAASGLLVVGGVVVTVVSYRLAVRRFNGYSPPA